MQFVRIYADFMLCGAAFMALTVVVCSLLIAASEIADRVGQWRRLA